MLTQWMMINDLIIYLFTELLGFWFSPVSVLDACVSFFRFAFPSLEISSASIIELVSGVADMKLFGNSLLPGIVDFMLDVLTYEFYPMILLAPAVLIFVIIARFWHRIKSLIPFVG